MDAGFDTDISLDVGMDAGFDTDFGIDAAADLSVADGLDAGLDATTTTGSSTSAVSHGGGIIPFNLMFLCLLLVVFGALGKMTQHLMTTLLPAVLLLTVCIASGGASYWALYEFLIKRLKQNDASALSYRELRGMDGEVTLAIPGDSIGTISLKDKTGAAISFRAKMDPHLKGRMPKLIPKGEHVVITEVDMVNKLCYVSMYQSKFTGNRMEE
jgi:membrane protein implicated in regulation of membrane protease activity